VNTIQSIFLIKLLGAETEGGLSTALCMAFLTNNGSKCPGEPTMVYLREKEGLAELQSSKGRQRKAEAAGAATAESWSRGLEGIFVLTIVTGRVLQPDLKTAKRRLGRHHETLR